MAVDGEDDDMEQAIRDCLVCGIRQEEIQRKLLWEENLDLTRNGDGVQASKRTPRFKETLQSIYFKESRYSLEDIHRRDTGRYDDQICTLPLVVVQGQGTPYLV